MDELREYIVSKFGISEGKFLEVLRKSPGAEGYLLGNLGEVLFKEQAEANGYEVLRIKEKPEGGDKAKSDDARGDFYIKPIGQEADEWFVVECKGVKSNSEKRSGLTKRSSCITLLSKHSFDLHAHVTSIYSSGARSYEGAKIAWENSNQGKQFPKFRWSQKNPGSGIPDLSGLWDSKPEVEAWLSNFPDEAFSEDAYWDLTAPIRLLQTHMPSTRTCAETGIKSTGPLANEFNILCVDLFLKTGKHEFVFANATQLNHQAKSPTHLQQNYTIDILTGQDDFRRHELLEPWFDDLSQCIAETKPIPRKIDITQLDSR